MLTNSLARCLCAWSGLGLTGFYCLVCVNTLVCWESEEEHWEAPEAELGVWRVMVSARGWGSG